MVMQCNIWWITRDIRLEDNKVLQTASRDQRPVLPVYILNPNLYFGEGQRKKLTFIFHQLENLNRQLSYYGTSLTICLGQTSDIVKWLKTLYPDAKVFTCVDFGNSARKSLQQVMKVFQVKVIMDSYLTDFEQIRSKQGKIFTIYSYFRNAAYKHIETHLERAESKEIPEWAKQLSPRVFKIEKQKVEEVEFSCQALGFEKVKLLHEGAIKSPDELLARFETILPQYSWLRNFPAKNGTSLLSAHLRYGTISVRKVVRWALGKPGCEKFIDEILWREFFSYLFYHFPAIETQGFREDRTKTWVKPSPREFEKVKNGQTGVPIIDAGLNQLFKEGFVHNRVRMIIASYLTKELGWDWRIGERLFAEHLIDYDPALNVGNWQWNAGVGVDPRSKYRRFNPFLQAKKFDADGEYISKYLKRGEIM